MVEGNPYYAIQVDCGSCYYHLSIDGIPLDSHTEFAGSSALLPANHMLRWSGSHSLTIKVLPRLHAKETLLAVGAFFEAELRLYKMPLIDALEFEPLLKIAIPPSTEKLPYFETTLEFHVDLPFELTDFRNSLVLTEIHGIEEVVHSFCVEYMDALASKEMEKYYTVVRQRENDIAEAMYFDEQRKREREKFLREILLDPKFVLDPIPLDATAVFFAEDRVVTLKTANGDNVFRGVLSGDDGEESEIDFPLLLHMPDRESGLVPL